MKAINRFQIGGWVDCISKMKATPSKTLTTSYELCFYPRPILFKWIRPNVLILYSFIEITEILNWFIDSLNKIDKRNLYDLKNVNLSLPFSPQMKDEKMKKDFEEAEAERS